MLDLLTKTSSIEESLFSNKINEESYFCSSIRFIQEINDIYRSNTKKLYNIIRESSDDLYIINEGFGDFFTGLKNVINKFIKFIKSIFDRFIAFLHKLVGSDKYIIKHEKDFAKFSTEDEFTFDGYKYSFSGNIPNIKDPSDKFDEIFKGAKLILEKDINDDEKLKNIKNYKDGLNSETALDVARGNTLNTESIDSTDFADELFKVFRSDNNTPDNLDITATDIYDALSFFKNYKKFSSSVEKEKREIERKYTKFSKEISKMVETNDSGILVINGSEFADLTKTNNPNIITAVDELFKVTSDIFIKVTSIYSLAFGAKLDAIKDCYKQDKAILYKAYSNILKNHRD